MRRCCLFTAILVIVILRGNAQDTLRIELGGYQLYAIVQNGDTLYVSSLDEAVIQPRKKSAVAREMRQNRRLIYNVKAVYPYAKLAGAKFGEVNAHMQSLKTGKEQREYLKQIEKEILDQYEEDLKNLTLTQGRILIKLIDRETSQTSYEVVKDLRGAFQAAFWQAIARLFGSNLKSEYDATGEDKLIEEIMVMIELGLL